VLYRPHRLYLFLAVAWLAIIVLVAPERWSAMAALSVVLGLLAAGYFDLSAKVYAGRLLRRVLDGEANAGRLYAARARSRLGDVARQYLTTLLGADEDERLLPLVVEQLDHPDVQAREMTENRLVRWGSRAAGALVEAVVGGKLHGDGAFRARRLLYRWRPELPDELQGALNRAGYWQEA